MHLVQIDYQKLASTLLLVFILTSLVALNELKSTPIFHKVRSDYKQFYSQASLLNLGLAFSGAALFAHSSWDQNVQNWYQRSCRNSSTDEISTLFKFCGEGYYLVPFSLLAGSLQLFPYESEFLETVSAWGERSSRAYLTGAPFLLLMQRATGASRPSEQDGSSEWDFFADENGVSGHAFIGAVPFLTIAELYRHNKPIYWSCTLLSTLPALSRINDNKHFPSQAFLGWFIAWQATQAVSSYQLESERFALLPRISGNNFGLVACWRW